MATLPIMFRASTLYAGDWRIPCHFDKESGSYEVVLNSQEPHSAEIVTAMQEKLPDVAINCDLLPNLIIVNFVPITEKRDAKPCLSKDGRLVMKDRPDKHDIVLPDYNELRHCLESAGFANCEIIPHSKAVYEVLVEGDFRNALYHKHAMERHEIPVRGFSFKNGRIAYLISYY